MHQLVLLTFDLVGPDVGGVVVVSGQSDEGPLLVEDHPQGAVGQLTHVVSHLGLTPW